MHTTASDGRLTPAELVVRADAAGLTTISVTDHDTVAALAEATVAEKPKGTFHLQYEGRLSPEPGLPRHFR